MRNITVSLSIFMLLLSGWLPSQSSETYLCGTPELSFIKEALRGSIQNPPDENVPRPLVPSAPTLPVGAERTFFAPDFRSMQQYTVSAVLRGIGSFCYVFVEASEWNTRVTAETVHAIVRAFDATTPANPQRGIYQTLTQAFGAPPDIDGNDKIILLLLNIRDTNHSNQYTAGFFNPADQSRGVLRNPGFRGFPIRSNEADMLYVDTQPLNPNSEAAHNVVAHELLHLIHWGHDPHEATWVDEGCAGYASFLCGYSVLAHVAAFERRPSISLITWPEMDTDALPHYGATFLWMLYLHEQHGGLDTLTEIVQNRGTSLTGVADALASNGTTQKISDIFNNWKLANYLSDYRTIRLSLEPQVWHRSYPSGTQDGQLSNFSADYIGFEDAGGLTVGFSSRSRESSTAHAIEFHNTGHVHKREIVLSTDGSGSIVLPDTVTKAILIPSLQSEASNAQKQNTQYQYNATRGAHITFVTVALPNPLHSQYWDIVAVPSEPLIGLVPSVTLIRVANNVERLHQESQAMYRVTPDSQNNHTYRLSFRLDPEITPESVTYQISLDSRIVDTKLLTDNSKGPSPVPETNN